MNEETLNEIALDAFNDEIEKIAFGALTGRIGSAVAGAAKGFSGVRLPVRDATVGNFLRKGLSEAQRLGSAGWRASGRKKGDAFTNTALKLQQKHQGLGTAVAAIPAAGATGMGTGYVAG